MRLGIKGKQVLGVTSIVAAVVVVLSLLHVANLAHLSLEESKARAELLADASLKIYDLRQAAGTRLLERLGCGSALITRGAEGMTLIEAPTAKGSSPNVHEIPSVPRPVYDVTGAGDTVIAVLALAYASGASMREASELANLAAGRVVLKFGTAGVSSQELLEAVKGES